MKDTYTSQAPIQGLASQVLTGDANGDSVDLQFYEAAQIIAAVGASGDTLSGSVLVDLEVEHADDDGTGSPDTWEDCADADLLNAVTGTNTGTFARIDDPAEDEAVYATGYIGGKRWVRVVANLTGTHTNGIPIGVVINRGHARHQNT